METALTDTFSWLGLLVSLERYGQRPGRRPRLAQASGARRQKVAPDLWISCAGHNAPPKVEPRAALPRSAPRTLRTSRKCRRRSDVGPDVLPSTSRANAPVPTRQRDGRPPSRFPPRHACRTKSPRGRRPASSTLTSRPRGSAPAQPRGARCQESPCKRRACRPVQPHPIRCVVLAGLGAAQRPMSSTIGATADGADESICAQPVLPNCGCVDRGR